ncbi:hypothetical protein ACSMXN_09375 [Jatrophihabitans sp. DSM 45814]
MTVPGIPVDPTEDLFGSSWDCAGCGETNVGVLTEDSTCRYCGYVVNAEDYDPVEPQLADPSATVVVYRITCGHPVATTSAAITDLIVFDRVWAVRPASDEDLAFMVTKGAAGSCYACRLPSQVNYLTKMLMVAAQKLVTG